LKFYVNETYGVETERRPRHWSVETETFRKTPRDGDVRDRDYNPGV